MSPLNSSAYVSVEDFPIGSLTAGPHFIKIVADANGEITESNETDNEYIKAINVSSASPTPTATPAPSVTPVPSATPIPVSQTFTVTNTNDNGPNSLRQALLNANSHPNPAGSIDQIVFNIPGSGVQTITRTTALPAISDAVVINGYTQPGASPNTNALNAGINAVVLIELIGASGDGVGGLRVNAAGTVIRGLNSHGSGDEIIVNASNVTIAGNFLGTNPAGTTDGCSICGQYGIRLESGDNNVFGGVAPADRNLLSGDKTGAIILESGNGTVIQGNYMGTDITGTSAINYGIGVRVAIYGPPGPLGTIILGNLISGNIGGGVQLGGGGVIQGNLIGTQRDGVSALGNLNDGGLSLGGNGDFITNGGPFVVGGTSPGQGNTIAFNSGGVHILNNLFGDSILGNSIFNNGLLGIRLFSGTPLANDACDVDILPGNRGQNYPLLTSASIAGGNVTISGTLNSAANTTFRVEFFSNAACHPSGNGEGQTFLGFTTVTTNASCNATF